MEIYLRMIENVSILKVPRTSDCLKLEPVLFEWDPRIRKGDLEKKDKILFDFY